MRVGLIIDQLAYRDYSTYILETVLSLFENDDITLYTLVHRPGQILGPINQCRVFSTFLSTFESNPRKLPQTVLKKVIAAGSLKISHDHDLLIVISSGSAELVRIPREIPAVLLKIHFNIESKILEYIKSKKEPHFNEKVSFQEESGFLNWGPFHRVDKIHYHNLELKHVCIFANEKVNGSTQKRWNSLLKELNLIVVWVGISGQNSEDVFYYANPCDSDLSAILNQSYFSIDLCPLDEPRYLLSMSAGRPVMVGQQWKSILETAQNLGLKFFDNKDDESIGQQIGCLLEQLKHVNSDDLHRNGAKRNAKNFKRQFWPLIRRLAR